jgi:hypothetical protein
MKDTTMSLSSLISPAGGLESAHETEKVKVHEVLLMYLLLMLSGNPFFIYHFQVLIGFSIIIPIIHIFTNSHRQIKFHTVFIFAFMLGYEVMHSFIFDLDYSLTIFKLTLVLLLAFSIVQILRDKFIKVLTQTMLIITVISFVFTALTYVPGLNWTLYDFALRAFPMQTGFKGFVTPTLLIYTFHTDYFFGEFSYVRNAGIFWESGAFAVYLNITLFLYWMSKRVTQVKDLFDKKSLVLIVGVLTTASTMGFLALMAILTFYAMQLRTALKYVFLLLMIAMGYLAFVSVEFLGDKISTQLEESDERNNRFGAALMDWKDIEKRPLLGSSRRIEVIFKTNVMSKATRRPNGLTNFLREYGLVYFTFYFVLIYISYKRIFYHYHNYYKASFAIFGVFLLWLVSFSEILFDLPFFKAIIFLFMVYLPTQIYEDEESEMVGQLESDLV